MAHSTSGSSRRENHDRGDETEPGRKASLSPREIEVLTWSARGKSAVGIGEILHISKRTVDAHASSAVRKIGATNRIHAVAIAVRDWLIEL
jgi:LuxR family transcriptional regulator, quorum-sensing system regulator BjaR1